MGSSVRWRTDFDKLVVTSNCERRGWQRWAPNEGEDWNFFWANVHTVKQMFNPDNGFRMGEHQMVCTLRLRLRSLARFLRARPSPSPQACNTARS
jgi:hypothetical protein